VVGTLEDYVLSPFTLDERKELPSVLEKANLAIEAFLTLGVDKAMTLVNQVRS
jgi:peptidyl-tRNA hydrolase